MGRITFLVQLTWKKNKETVGSKDNSDFFLIWSRAHGPQEGEQREKGDIFCGGQRSLCSTLFRHWEGLCFCLDFQQDEMT